MNGRLFAVIAVLVSTISLVLTLFTPGVPAQSPFDLAGCAILPADNIWNTPVDSLPVDARSALYVATIGATTGLHADFGADWNGGPFGIPYTTVPGTQARVAITFDYDDESDPGPYPIPPDAPIEGGADSSGDRHVLVVDRDHCVLYELWNAWPQADGSWRAGSGAVFALTSNALRPAGWTSADAAGLPILPGLVRYDEVASGEIRHALRFTAPRTRRAYVWPARHFASSLTGEQYPPMGQRFCLRADLDITDFSPEVQVILRALKKYGMFLADNGSAWYLSGAPDERWDDDVLRELNRVKGSDFEAVDESGLMVAPDSGRARTPTAAPTPTQVLSIPGDLDWDCDVDIVDIMLVASRWGVAAGETNYDVLYDLDHDGDIDVVDIMWVASHWGDFCQRLTRWCSGVIGLAVVVAIPHIIRPVHEGWLRWATTVAILGYSVIALQPRHDGGAVTSGAVTGRRSGLRER